MSARVIPYWAMTCDEHGITITGISSEANAQWYADEHDRDLHAIDRPAGVAQ